MFVESRESLFHMSSMLMVKMDSYEDKKKREKVEKINAISHAQSRSVLTCFPSVQSVRACFQMLS